MTPILNPVWPWSRPWAELAQLPGLFVVLTAIAAALALALPPLALRGARRPVCLGLAAALFVTLLLLSRGLGGPALAAARQSVGSGLSAYPVGLLLLLGWLLLLVAPTALAGLAVGAALGTPGQSPGRVAVVAGLRLAAFVLAIVALLRPALAWSQRGDTRAVFYVLLDRSRSMTIQDESRNWSRWKLAVKSLADADPAIKRLRDDHRVDVRIYTFADDLAEFDPDTARPDGRRTDIGGALRKLFDLREPRVPLRGVAHIGDGADNGTGVPALAEAARWRRLPCPIHTFVCGSDRTRLQHNDVALTSISTSPTPFVPVKGRLTVKVTADAHGYENSKARVRLFIESADDKGVVADREVKAVDAVLTEKVGNEITLSADAPARAQEIKVKVVIETTEKDEFPTNNVIETFVTVSKEGISVLLVDRARPYEPLFIHDALSEDPRIRVTSVLLRGDRPSAGGKLFSVDEQPYDAILLGDVTVKQLRALDPQAPEKIEQMAGRGTGVMVLGGYSNLGNGDWKGSPLEKVLPVELAPTGQLPATKEDEPDPELAMVPTADGLRRAPYILRLEEGADLTKAWARLSKLRGATRLELPRERRGTELVLARADDATKGEPLLIMGNYARRDATGKATAAAARVLVFGGDTTHRWRRSAEGVRLHGRFWRQVVVWLARQEDADGSVWVKPDVRRLPVRGELGFAVGIRGKGGGPDLPAERCKLDVEVQGPDGTTTRIPVSAGSSERRGTFTATAKPGVYKVVVRGEGTDPVGGAVSGQAAARVIVYDEDVEMLQPAADTRFMKALATAGGGEANGVRDLADFLNRLAERPLDADRHKQLLRPDWSTTQFSPFLIAFYAAFGVVVCLEWGLRRKWGMA